MKYMSGTDEEKTIYFFLLIAQFLKYYSMRVFGPLQCSGTKDADHLHE